MHRQQTGRNARMRYSAAYPTGAERFEKWVSDGVREWVSEGVVKVMEW